MIFHPVVAWSLVVRSWTWLKKLFSKAENPAVPCSLAATIRRVSPNGGWFEFCFSWQKGGALPQAPAAPAIGQTVNQSGPPAYSAPPLQLDLRSNSDSALPVPASLLPLIVGN
jgi:hypothetical protein